MWRKIFGGGKNASVLSERTDPSDFILCKLLIDENDVLLGCHILGNPASELILIAGIAIADGSTVEEFRRHIFPHPTVGEIIHEVLFS